MIICECDAVKLSADWKMHNIKQLTLYLKSPPPFFINLKYILKGKRVRNTFSLNLPELFFKDIYSVYQLHYDKQQLAAFSFCLFVQKNKTKQ